MFLQGRHVKEVVTAMATTLVLTVRNSAPVMTQIVLIPFHIERFGTTIGFLGLESNVHVEVVVAVIDLVVWTLVPERITL